MSLNYSMKRTTKQSTNNHHKNKVYVTVEKVPETDVTTRCRTVSGDKAGERIGIFTSYDLTGKNRIICKLHDEGQKMTFTPKYNHMISKYKARHNWHYAIIDSMKYKDTEWLGPCYMKYKKIQDMQLYVSGTIDGDESFEEAAIREINEEIGLPTKKITLVLSKSGDAWLHAIV